VSPLVAQEKCLGAGNALRPGPFEEASPPTRLAETADRDVPIHLTLELEFVSPSLGAGTSLRQAAATIQCPGFSGHSCHCPAERASPIPSPPSIAFSPLCRACFTRR
jgi:hypothetical protein